MNTKIPFTGGCVCDAVSYEITAEPIMMLKCHCRDCQQITGGGFAAADAGAGRVVSIDARTIALPFHVQH